MAAKGYLEHMAFYVRDLEWHIKFFEDVLGMKVWQEKLTADGARQVWTTGGLQLIQAPGFETAEGRFAHLGVMVDDPDEAAEAALAYGASLSEDKKWARLPEGLLVEFMLAAPGSVAQALAVKPRGCVRRSVNSEPPRGVVCLGAEPVNNYHAEE